MPSLIVLHYTAMQSADAAVDRLCDPQAEVSSHYLIACDGHCLQLVPEDKRAWHAGAGQWAGQQDINSRSIGIELDNRGSHPFPEPQMVALETLLRDLMTRWDISPAGVLGHSDIAPGRKQDPGPRFDWARLARQGLAAATPSPQEGPVSDAAFRRAARAAGYTADVPVETLLAATRLRHGPWRQGPLCAADFALPPI
ncbi:N-acetylmuramoyl-L-alanine amidase [Sulfitobacter sp. THAF37]|uniref:N-acetylmuramoyl-L-alanine amidase n=1 Tax=Sulfitobacter sp. THAF37 TaxID=2587855 RepID=UPI0020C75434|nr:N-acetylmuramoyl-L-alanine amidase [Sulfitobacter sp. THAF37]